MTNYSQKEKEIRERLVGNQPAFPVSFNLGEESIVYAGMGLRDYFAGQALAGIAARCTIEGSRHKIAEIAYSIADAMMKAREDK